MSHVAITIQVPKRISLKPAPETDPRALPSIGLRSVRVSVMGNDN